MFCPQCGTQIGSGVSFCFKCGADVSVLSGARPTVPAVPAAVAAPTLVAPLGQPFSHAGVAAVYAPAIVLADVGKRAGAYIIDCVVVGIILAATYAVVAAAAPSMGVTDVNLVQLVIGYTLCWLYFLFCDKLSGATLGKKAFGIRAVRLDGSGLPLGSAFVRSILKSPFPIGVAVVVINIITVLVTKRKQALHDMAAGTIVIDTQAQAEDVPGVAHVASVVPAAAPTLDATYERVPFGHQIAAAEREFSAVEGCHLDAQSAADADRGRNHVLLVARRQPRGREVRESRIDDLDPRLASHHLREDDGCSADRAASDAKSRQKNGRFKSIEDLREARAT